MLTPPFITAMIIPTGIGALSGGFAGDATPYLNLMASVSDCIITHPNVANAAVFQKMPDNALYVEGYGLDQFFKGQWGLRPVRQNKIGVVFDSGIPEDMLILHQNTINAVRSVYGVNVITHCLTQEPVEVKCEQAPTGCSSGGIKNPQVLFDATQQLLEEGVEAIAVCTLMPESTDAAGNALEQNYQQNSGVDPIGGIEAIVSHCITAKFAIPCAHAPVFPWYIAEPVRDKVLDPKVAAEFIAPTFLPCVLQGLSRAPQYTVTTADHFDSNQPLNLSQSISPHLSLGNPNNTIAWTDCSVLVVPDGVLGGLPMIAMMSQLKPVVVVTGNKTQASLGRSHVKSLFANTQPAGFDLTKLNIVEAASYEEAAGIVQMMRLGLFS